MSTGVTDEEYTAMRKERDRLKVLVGELATLLREFLPVLNSSGRLTIQDCERVSAALAKLEEKP